MLVSTNEAGSAVAAFGVVPLIAKRVFLIESALGLGVTVRPLGKNQVGVFGILAIAAQKLG